MTPAAGKDDSPLAPDGEDARGLSLSEGSLVLTDEDLLVSMYGEGAKFLSFRSSWRNWVVGDIFWLWNDGGVLSRNTVLSVPVGTSVVIIREIPLSGDG